MCVCRCSWCRRNWVDTRRANNNKQHGCQNLGFSLVSLYRYTIYHHVLSPPLHPPPSLSPWYTRSLFLPSLVPLLPSHSLDLPLSPPPLGFLPPSLTGAAPHCICSVATISIVLLQCCCMYLHCSVCPMQCISKYPLCVSLLCVYSYSR